ncbi:ketoacyl-ACP synthase III [Aestuariirhabdus haliotis]|uniref:ketoacyl-ACP synthase III n=1 Tax=Aestuariirhabdus haliotis TaxID=2918751 RepID=UPI0020BF2F43|nr:ketoacyl-ACP synthase III [Aestuariirhabdus haliotis]MCL6419719.1 ketoacyl-ACP synthase III [Aestuariirhabdus haliotis]
MIGIKGVASFLPENCIDNITQALRFGESEDFIQKKIGARKLPRKTGGDDTSDLVVYAVEALFKKYPALKRENIDALVVVTQNGDGEGLPHTAAIAQEKLGLSTSVAAFDISLGCSGYVYGLYVLKGFMEAVGFRNAVLVTADPYSKVIDDGDRVTALLFGDASTATWLGLDAEWELGPSHFGTDGSGSDYLQVKEQRLQMNGRQVYNFAALRVAPHIEELLKTANLSAGDIDAYCLHQGSMAILEAISRRFPEIKERFVKDMCHTGNTVSSSIPLLLEDRLGLEEWNRIIISGFGVGLSWASALLIKNRRKQ